MEQINPLLLRSVTSVMIDPKALIYFISSVSYLTAIATKFCVWLSGSCENLTSVFLLIGLG